MADDDMTTDTTRTYQDPSTAALGERVTNLGRRQTDLESEMRTGFRGVETAISSLANETRNSIATISTSLSERSRPQWAILISVVSLSWAILGGLGLMALQPVRESMAETKSDMRSIAEKMVSRQEMDWRAARGIEDRQRMEEAIKSLRAEQVPRAEQAREWAGADQRFSDVQRQIDDLKQAQGSVYGARDIILDLKDRINIIERQKDPIPRG